MEFWPATDVAVWSVEADKNRLLPRLTITIYVFCWGLGQYVSHQKKERKKRGEFFLVVQSCLLTLLPGPSQSPPLTPPNWSWTEPGPYSTSPVGSSVCKQVSVKRRYQSEFQPVRELIASDNGEVHAECCWRWRRLRNPLQSRVRQRWALTRGRKLMRQLSDDAGLHWRRPAYGIQDPVRWDSIRHAPARHRVSMSVVLSFNCSRWL